MLSPEAKKRIYNQAKAILAAQVKARREREARQKRREIRLGCLVLLATFFLFLLGDTRTEK